MKVVLAAAMYSPNLGDGVIAECFSHHATQVNPGIEIHWLDLSGRTDFSPPSAGSFRTVVLEALSRLPVRVANFVSASLVRTQIQRKLEPQINETFRDADALIIGGGQLFGDANLNFPLKLTRVVDEAEARGMGIAIQAVGVAEHWTPEGSNLFARVLASANLKYVSVRDRVSKERLTRHCHRLNCMLPAEIRVVPDPGILSNELASPRSSAKSGMGPLVGIGITHSAAIRTHTDSRTAPSIKTSIQRYSALSRALLADGYKVSLFTNGAQEDEEMLDLVVKELHRQNVSDVVRHDRPQTPLGLIEQIGRFDALISHRLHANIVAYSLGVPAIALSWDSKVDAFLESVGLGSRLADGTLASIDAIQNKLGRALAETDTPNNPVNIGTDARQAIREVLESVLDELKHPAA